MDDKQRARANPEDPDEGQTYNPEANGQLIRDDVIDDPDMKCGIGGFYPDSMQVFARIGAFVGVYSASGLLTSTLSVYVNSQVSMLEKQFGFSSAETGLIMSCNDIGYLAFVIFAGYLATKVHIPRGLGLSTFLFGLSGIMCALPYFLVDQSEYDIDVTSVSTGNTSRTFAKQVPMCVNGTNDGLDGGCSDMTSAEVIFSLEKIHTKKVAMVLICVGMVIQGIGKAPRYPFITLYIDDSVEKRKTGFYMGIIISTAIFGPALAYMLGGLFSRMYVTLKDVPISPRDPRWVGAWWLGFLVFGLISTAASLPIMCFPRKLPSAVKHAVPQDKEEPKGPKKTLSKFLLSEGKEFGASLLRLARNPIYVCLSVSNVINLIGVAGFLAFMPKFIASQYSIPVWHANIILAICNISSVSLASFLGGILTRRSNMTPKKMFIYICVFMVFNMMCVGSGFFLGCDQPAIVGDNGMPDVTSGMYQSVSMACDKGCQCDDSQYFPICGDDGHTYFSPCHAGCTLKAGMEFVNCTCIPTGRASGGLCDQGCTTKLYVFAALLFIGSFFKALKIIPTFVAKVRCVEERDRAVGTSMSTFLTSSLGWMPGPVLVGYIIDGTCSLWQYKCDERLSCQMYNIVAFRQKLLAFGTITTGIAILPLLVIIYLVRNKKDWHETVAKRDGDVTMGVKK